MKRVYSRENTFVDVRVLSGQPDQPINLKVMLPNFTRCHPNLGTSPT